MFDIGASELLLIVIVAAVVIGPKDLPLALRTAGRWMAKVRRVSGHFRAGVDAMIREAELEELEREWKVRNEEIMKAHPDAGEMPPGSTGAESVLPAPQTDSASGEPQAPAPPP
ncbi:MAG: twin-arginine translocase subunit TatB [Novosphingobium sp.]|nr:twin-arginine translocase subunit TatB [Novosphingobium sp.]